MKRYLTVVLVVVTIALIVAGCAPSQTPAAPTTPATSPAATPTPAKSIELKLATLWPKHAANTVAEWYTTELEKRTQGRVKMTVYPGTLGTAGELIGNVQKGVADIGVVFPSFSAGQLPMWDVFGVPLLFGPGPSVHYVSWDLYYQGYLDIKDTKVIAMVAAEAVRFVSNKKVNTLEDFKGIVVRDFGGAWTEGAKLLGMSPTTIPAAELYGAFQQHIVDAALLGIGLATANRLNEVAKYVMWNDFGQSCIPTIMNLNRWNSLPADVQMIMEELNREYNYRLQDSFCQSDQPDTIQKAGMEVYKLGPAEFSRVASVLTPLLDKWVTDVEAKGLPGKKVKDLVLWDLKKMGYR